MGLTFVDPDLDEIVVVEAGRRLYAHGQPDPVLITGDIGYEEPFEPRQSQKPKPEISERLRMARKKAQLARAIVNNQRRRDPTLPDYNYGVYILYFWTRPDREPKDMVTIIMEQQREKLGVSSQSQPNNYVKSSY